MFRNYLKIAVRNIKKNKGFSLLNMVGLSLGLTCAILILLWIQDELNYNTFHKKYDTLYQVLENHHYDAQTYTFPSTPGPLAAGMREEMPEVKNATRMCWGERWLFKVNEKTFFENGNYVDPQFLDMFTFDFIYGDAKQALMNEQSIVITKRMSEKFFGDSNPVGKYIKVNDKSEFMITGVVETPPLNSSLNFDWLASFKLFEEQNPNWQNWTHNSMQTFVELKPTASIESFNKKFSSYISGKNSDASGKPLLFAMKDWRLRRNFEEGKQAGGRIEYVRLFGVIAFLLIVIACINFMNLATARSEKRAKEVGLRKVMGAKRENLMVQFIGESVVMSFASMLIACLLVLAFLPSFNTLVGKELSIGVDKPLQWLIFAGLALICGIIAGSYPSIYLSSFKPVSIFKGFRSGGGNAPALIRKGLVVSQFVISIVLIVSTVVIYKQIDHVKKRNLGYDKNNLIYLSQKGKINEKLDVIEQDLLASGVVAHAAGCNQTVLEMGNNTSGISWEGKNPEKEVLVTTDFVTSDYIHTTGMKLLSGRNFIKGKRADSLNVIINATMAKLIGKQNLLNTPLSWDTTHFTIVGVVQDFVFNDMYKTPDPVVLFNYPALTSHYFIRLKENTDLENSLSKIEAVFKKDNPGYPFEYHFLDEDFNRQFNSEMLIGKLSRVFAILTIIISCIGLFGLAAFTAERRTKEVGIRKVLGASVRHLVSLLSKDFLKLVLIAFIIACPIAWYIMNKWLMDYAYRIDIGIWMFAVAGILSFVIAFMTVSLQAVKAAIANPVKSLRTE